MFRTFFLKEGDANRLVFNDYSPHFMLFDNNSFENVFGYPFEDDYCLVDNRILCSYERIRVEFLELHIDSDSFYWEAITKQEDKKITTIPLSFKHLFEVLGLDKIKN